MDMNDRPTPVKRSDSLLRLRTVTAGVAVAGVAATVGFGFAAAGGYRGTSGTGADAPVDAGAQDTTSGADATPIPFQRQAPVDTGTSPGTQPQQVAPQDNGSGATTPGTVVQPPTRSSRRGHASTGSS
jgi:hypothetical protein